jgi:la-related protein 1
LKVDTELSSTSTAAALTNTTTAAASSTESSTATSPVTLKSHKTSSESQGSSKKSKDVASSASSSSSAGSSAASTTATTPVDKKAGLTPAAVPIVNAWQKRSSVGGPEETGKGDKSLDSVNWPKPDESSTSEYPIMKKETGVLAPVAAALPPAKPRSGKEKWIPYTPAPGPANGSGAANGGGNKRNQKVRPSQNGRTSGQSVASPVEKRNSVGNNSVNNGKKKPGPQFSPGQQQQQHSQQQLQQEPQKPQQAQNILPEQPAPVISSAGSNVVPEQPAQTPITVTPQSSEPRPAVNSPVETSPNGVDSPTKKSSPPPKHEKNLPFKDKPRFKHEDTNGFHSNHHRNMYRRPPHFKNFYMQQDYMYGQPFLPIGPIPANQYEVTLGLIVAQIEYYMSVENLCKDMYLRRQMNSKGYIPLSILAGFNRVRILTGGDMNLLIDACNWAPSSESLNSKIRPRNGWENWVLPPKERDPAGLEEDTTGNDDESPKLVFDAAAAIPFIPKEARATHS